MAVLSEGGRGAALAARIKRSIEGRAEQARLARIAEERRRALVEQERAALLNDLVAFGQACGHLQVSRPDGAVVLSYNGRSLRFEPAPEVDRVKLSAEHLAGENQVFLHEVLGKWVWSYRPKTGAEQQRPLFDAGLEELLLRALDLQVMSEAELASLEGSAAAGTTG